MVAMSDTHPEVGAMNEADDAKILRETMRDRGRVNNAGRIFFGAVLCISAGGMWVVPGGDAAMLLIKLLVSVVMLGLGVMFVFSARQGGDEPEVVIDAENRVLHLIGEDTAGFAFKQATHKFDELHDVQIEKRRFSARNANGDMLFDVNMADSAITASLKDALKGIA